MEVQANMSLYATIMLIFIGTRIVRILIIRVPIKFDIVACTSCAQWAAVYFKNANKGLHCFYILLHCIWLHRPSSSISTWPRITLSAQNYESKLDNINVSCTQNINLFNKFPHLQSNWNELFFKLLFNSQYLAHKTASDI